jgi:alginate O-acetyltransferase complex protein AlgI
MLFNSYIYIFFFLPVTLIGYFVFNRYRLIFLSKLWLLLASLVFYGYWSAIYVPLIAGSILFNYIVGRTVSRLHLRGRPSASRGVLLTGLFGNLGLLAYFKYMDFFIANLNSLGSLSIRLMHVALPLGISFFTFTQIAYLVDSYRGKVRESNLVNYGLFVTFFPHLLAGPILHHSEMMPQFDNLRNKLVDVRNLSGGLYLFFVGLFKKVVIADTFAAWANTGFANPADLTTVEAWAVSLAYTLQLYYDFSGYTDMALGSSQMFNIRLPINFDSPYRALDIQEFWRRWHMTLGRFMRDYVYIPLGGNRVPEVRILLNVMVTFFLVGLWHGAGWTFVVWGSLHGAALAIHRLWKKVPVRLPAWLAWLITFNFVNAGFVIFRADSLPKAFQMIKTMAGLKGTQMAEPLAGLVAQNTGFWAHLAQLFSDLGNERAMLCVFLVFFPLSFLLRNSNEMVRTLAPSSMHMVFFSLIAFVALLYLGAHSEFLYFRF